MGARELLHELAGAGLHIRVNGDKLTVWPAEKLNDNIRAAIRENKPQLMVLLTRPYRLSQADADAAHAEPWDDAAIGLFTQRVMLFLRRGINATDADDLAERLHLRDVQADGRKLCLECKHLAGRRCGNAHAAGVGRELPDALVMQLQRCPGFKDAT